MTVADKYVVYDRSPNERADRLSPIIGGGFATRWEAREYARKTRRSRYEAKIFKLVEVR